MPTSALSPHRVTLEKWIRPLLFAGALGLLASEARTAVPLAPTRGRSLALEPHFIGFNQPFAGMVDPWNGGNLLNQLKTIEGAGFRYPAGTLGSYWNWKTGRLDESLDKKKVMEWVGPMMTGRGNYKPLHLLTPVREARIAPIWMLGMAVHDVGDYIAELKKAEAAGIPVRYVELGNEIIFKDAEPLLEERFPTPERYAEEANRYIVELKKAFPQAKIAACGSFVASASQSERRRTWNERMMKVLRGADAITFHLYVHDIRRSEQERVGLSEVASQNRPTAAARESAALPLTPARIASSIDVAYGVVEKSFAMTKMPTGMPVWVTEWNPSGAGGTADHWLGGLVALALLDAYLHHNVTLTCHHTLGSAYLPGPGGAGRNNASGVTLNAPGLALRLFARATTGMTGATSLTFDGTPRLCGWQFNHGETRRTLLLNFTGTSHTLEQASLGQAAAEILQLAAAPDAPAATIKERRIPTGASLTLPAYSATLLR